MNHTDYYIVTGSVIPILLLSGSVQADLYARYVRSNRIAERKGAPWIARATAILANRLVVGSVAVVAFATILFAAHAEWTAVTCLENGSDAPSDRGIVLTGLGLLLLVNGIGVVAGLLEVVPLSVDL
jgi:hypothetical protein